MNRMPPAQHCVEKPPGQTINRHPVVTLPKLLADEIARVLKEEAPPKKLTFEGWCASKGYGPIFLENNAMMEDAWYAGQENK